MPAFNAARFIDAALRSLLAERVPLDIVVIDDGSTDDTRDIIARLAAGAPAIRLLSNPGKGIAAARNTGLRNLPADCDVVTFHDADDLCFPGRIARQRKRLEDDPAIDGLYGLVQMFSVQDDMALGPARGTPVKVVRGPYLQSAMFRRAVIDRTGPFDETYRQGCDSEYFLRLIEAGFRIELEDELAAYYRRHDANVTLNTAEMKREFMRASLSWAARNRLRRGSLPAIYSRMFLQRAELEQPQ
jgi:glycosyltransferase involved in cell wall biosynthesis